ncbi:MAG: cupin domain-containing protein [Prevotella sp.]|nr:cupin domain-containing protein [Prevotella sp.]
MKIDFNHINEITVQKMNGGEGECHARIFVCESGKIIYSILPAGSSIGLHPHSTSKDINYIVSGTGKAICNEYEETLLPGNVHFCPKGATHSIVNTGDSDLVLFTVVTEV